MPLHGLKHSDYGRPQRACALTRVSLALIRVPGVRSTSDAWAPPFTCELDAVFDHERTQEEVYAVLGEAAVEDFLRGINATIFAYGQTGTGKTYSMYGSEQALLRFTPAASDPEPSGPP
jgi:hypothetical protein